MIRKAIFASQGWYPANRLILEKMFTDLMPEKPEGPISDIKGIISPHAGYVYSLKTALHAYIQIENAKYNRVFVLGPSHRSGCNGKAVLSDYSGFETPFGTLSADVDFSSIIASENPDLFYIDNIIHAEEHSLEMQMPLLKHMLGSVRIIPIIMPPSDYSRLDKIGTTIGNYLKEGDLIIMSSDLSHFPSKKTAEEIDADAMGSWRSLNPETIWQTEEKWSRSKKTDCAMCGISAIVSGIKALNVAFKNLEVRGMHHSTSADVSDDDSRVVGYGASVIHGGKK
jgi:MEMO1 family protein